MWWWWRFWYRIGLELDFQDRMTVELMRGKQMVNKGKRISEFISTRWPACWIAVLVLVVLSLVSLAALLLLLVVVVAVVVVPCPKQRPSVCPHTFSLLLGQRRLVDPVTAILYHP